MSNMEIHILGIFHINYLHNNHSNILKHKCLLFDPNIFQKNTKYNLLMRLSINNSFKNILSIKMKIHSMISDTAEDKF